MFIGFERSEWWRNPRARVVWSDPLLLEYLAVSGESPDKRRKWREVRRLFPEMDSTGAADRRQPRSARGPEATPNQQAQLWFHQQ